MESTLDGILLRDPSHGAAMPVSGDEAGPVLAVLFVRSGVGGCDRFAVRSPLSRLGRSPGNDIVLVAPSVAAEHAELRLRGGLWSLRALVGPSGALVDGLPVIGSALLAPGSEIQLGEVRLTFDSQDRWEDSQIERAAVGEAVEPEMVVVHAAPEAPVAEKSGAIDWANEAEEGAGDSRQAAPLLLREQLPRESRYREASTPFLVLPESESTPRRVWVIAVIATAVIVAVAYFLFQVR